MPVGELQTNAFLAILTGAALAVLAFVPVAAIRYRRQGTFPLIDLVRTAAVPIYLMALWTYTLLPLPARDDVVCARRQTEAFRFVTDIENAWDGRVADLLRDPVFLQVGFNVLLFVPLGWFVRTVAGRGVVVSTGLGFAVSLLIETTQRTGLWGLYECAYRVFDVDDLIVNTAGALIGSLVSLVVVRRREPVRARPRRISAGRRLVSLTSDLLVMVLLGAAAATAWRGWEVYGLGEARTPGGSTTQQALQYLVPLAVQTVLVLGTGRSAGEWVTDLRTVGGRGPVVLARLVKWCAGVGLFTLLLWLDAGWTWALLVVFVIATAGWAVIGDHRGLANSLAGLRVEIDEDHRPGDAHAPASLE